MRLGFKSPLAQNFPSVRESQKPQIFTGPIAVQLEETKVPLTSFRPWQPDIAEMWKDYRVFKAAGLLSEWRKKWAYYLQPLTA